MNSTRLIGAAIIALMLAFGWFAFRQGTKVTPEKDKDPFGGLPPGGAGPPPIDIP
jgi:hypothetical protein